MPELRCACFGLHGLAHQTDCDIVGKSSAIVSLRRLRRNGAALVTAYISR